MLFNLMDESFQDFTAEQNTEIRSLNRLSLSIKHSWPFKQEIQF